MITGSVQDLTRDTNCERCASAGSVEFGICQVCFSDAPIESISAADEPIFAALAIASGAELERV